MRQPTKLFLCALGSFTFCILVFEDCASAPSDWYTTSSQEDAADSSVAAETASKPVKAERSEAAIAPHLAARSELEKVTEERDVLRSRLSLFHLDGEINDLLYEPGDPAAAAELHWEGEDE